MTLAAGTTTTSMAADTKPPKNPLASFFGGASAGLASSLLLQPFEVVKTKMQGQKISSARGMITIAQDVVKQQGIKGLWRGVSASCVRTTAGAGLYFFLLERVTKELKSREVANTESSFTRSVITFSSGASARTVAAILLNPITVVKTRMEYGGVQGKGLVGALAALARKEGSRGLFCGVGTTIMRDAPFSGLNLLLFTQTRTLMNEVARLQERETGAFDTFVAGALAGAGATFMTHPPDVIRTRVQLGRMMQAQSGGTRIPVSLTKIIKEEGFRALWVGSLPRLARRTVQQAITWSLFDIVSRQFGGNFLTEDNKK